MSRSLILPAVLLGLLALPLDAQYSGAEDVPGKLAEGFGSIDTKSAEEWLGYLASDELEGRFTGSEGYMKAARFMAERFKEFGLEPVGPNESYFQDVPFSTRRVVEEESHVSVPSAGLRLASGKDVSFTAADEETMGDVVFIKAQGSRAQLPDRRVVRGKVVVIDGLDPANTPLLRMLFFSRPKAVLVVSEEIEPSEWRVRSPFSGRGTVRGRITREAARRLAEAVKVPPAILEAEPGRDQLVFKAGRKQVGLVVRAESGEKGVPNVVGLLPGSDPELSGEVVAMGSHLDHLGVRGGRINNGADDDGSGTTALLLVARAFAKNPRKPRRSMLFMAFCGEELGLVGSRYYAANPLIPLKRTVAELQMDMVGRNESGRNESAEENLKTLHLVGSRRLSEELHRIILEMNRYVGFTFEYDEEDVYTRSDHYSFASKGVPIAFFFSGFHPDYHKPTDTVDKINFEKLANVARLVYLSTWYVADMERPLKVDKGPFKNH